MNRHGNADTYLRLIDDIRNVLPDSVIRSTFLTGFPGETDDDFRALLDFQDRARLDWAGVFTYSREEDTPAYALKGRVPKRIAVERKARIEEGQVPISEARMDRFIGRTMEVLVEERIAAAKPEPGQTLPPGNSLGGFTPDPEALPGNDLYLGRLFCQAPEVDGLTVIHAGGPLRPGEFVRGRVLARSGFDLELRV
jgi:ribosomal protein S12 methylthiotransferase